MKKIFIMKKFVIVIMIIAGVYTSGFAQPHDVGKSFGTIGVGVGQNFSRPLLFTGSVFTPAIRATYEVGMWEAWSGTITLGGLFGFSNYSYKYPYTIWNVTQFRTYDVKERHLNLAVAARSSYYYSFQDIGDLYMLNAYVVLELGARFDLVGYNDVPNSVQTESSSIYPHFGTYLGANWHFNDQWAAFIESGYGLTWTTIGMVYRFN